MNHAHPRVESRLSPTVSQRAQARPKTKTKRNAEMVRLYVDEHMTLEAIGTLFGVTRERVRQIVRRAGIGSDVTATNFAFRSEANLMDTACETCGKVMRRQPSEVTRFCSRRCWGRARAMSAEHLLRELRRLALVLDRTPGTLDLVAPHPNHTLYYQRFGSLAQAQEIAGLTPNTRGARPGCGPGQTRRRPLPDGFREQWAHLADEIA